jgi:hypothetical protein
METLQLLAVALGLASLAGLRLYLTVFVTGLAIHENWIVLSPHYAALAPLGHPMVLGLSGALCLIEFFADKVPWIDSLWDSIHTVIRPVAGATLALRVFGQTSAVFDVILAILAGGISLSMHGTKAGVRLLANGSPEPFSNIALSIGEELLVIGGLVLLYINPVVALAVLALFLSAIGWFAPKLWRGIRVILWLFWKKARWPAASNAAPEDLPKEIPSNLAESFKRHNLLRENVAWAVPCISAGSKLIPPNLFGLLVATEEDPRSLTFVAKRGFASSATALDLANCQATQESQFLSENLVLSCGGKRNRFVFLFPRPEAERVSHLVAAIQQRLASPE